MRIRELTTIRIDAYPNLLIVKVTSDEGLIGLGETFIGPEAVETVIHREIAPHVLGGDIRGVPALADRLAGYVGFTGTGTECRARSAVDLALWDLHARHLDVPLNEALGGATRTSIRTYNTCAGPNYVRAAHHRTTTRNWGLDDSSPYEDLQWFMEDAGGLAESLLAEGITGMKIWPFDPAAEITAGQHLSDAELDTALEPFRKIRDTVGNAIDIKVELHGLWNLPSAMRIVRALEPFSPTWIEDPIRPDDTDALVRLKAGSSTPIAVGETIAGLHAYRDLIARGATDVVIVDLSWCGGITEALRVAALADAWHLPVAPHDCVGPVTFAASVHFSTHVRNAIVQESVRAYTNGWYREIVTETPPIENGMIRPVDGAGIGIELQPDLTSRSDVHLRSTTAMRSG